jgi:hypothetical protein
MKTDYNKHNISVRANPGKGIAMILMILFVILISSAAYSQEEIPVENLTDNTAIIMPVQKWETGIFQSFRLGLNEKNELRSNALLFPILPNAGIKHLISTNKGVIISSLHRVSIPSVFLNIMSFKGTGGLISPQYSFPFIMTLSNSLLVTKRMASSYLTAEAGFSIAIRGKKPDYRSSVDIPFIYQRMAYYYEGTEIKAGLSYKGKISGSFYFEERAKLIVITRKSDNLFIENSGSVLWSSKGSLRLKGGYILSWGRYPFGDHLQMWPAFDIIFGSRHATENK